MADVSILDTSSAAVPKAYEVAGAQEIILKGVTASFDGSGAGGSWIPALQVVDPSGFIVGTYTCSTTVAAGSSVDVSWFPRGGVAVSAAAGRGVSHGDVASLTLTVPDSDGSTYFDADASTFLTNDPATYSIDVYPAGSGSLTGVHGLGIHQAGIYDVGVACNLNPSAPPIATPWVHSVYLQLGGGFFNVDGPGYTTGTAYIPGMQNPAGGTQTWFGFFTQRIQVVDTGVGPSAQPVVLNPLQTSGASMAGTCAYSAAFVAAT